MRMDDLISRQDAIRWVKTECNPYGKPTLDFESGKKVIEHLKNMPSAQPERLTDDDFETIRIHLNAFKENLCNQQRWGEAEEYQRIIDRFMAFASAQPEHGRWEDCSNGWMCSVCKHDARKDYPYCPNCGAYMMEDYKNG